MGKGVKIYTVGFTRKSAQTFFGLLRNEGIRRLVDIRLNNTGQLAGFTKKDDLAFFLRELGGIEYIHDLRLAPSEEILEAYLEKSGNRKRPEQGWGEYEKGFMELLRARQLEQDLPELLLTVPTVLLCSESSPDYCHRRLITEYLAEFVPDLEAVHL